MQFFPTVVGGLGFSRNASYSMTAPPFILAAFCMLLNGFHSDKVTMHHSSHPQRRTNLPSLPTQKRERFLHVMIPLLITALANIIAVSTLNVGARYWP